MVRILSSMRLGVRAAVATGAYVAAAAATLLTVILLRGHATSDALRGFLGFLFIATLAAGLEPATAKAAALSEDGARAPGARALLLASGLKALAASPCLALVWSLSDPALGPGELAWTPAIVVAGFCATDLRVLLDLRGDHAGAIALKQGSLAGGMVLAGLLMGFRAPLGLAVGVSTMARLAPLLLWGLIEPDQGALAEVGGRVGRLLADRRWLELAAVSLIAAIGGSTDRLFGLRYLGPEAYGGYYVIYEILTKFWLIPYLLGPVVFARQAAGDHGQGFVRVARRLTLAAGAVFVAGVAGALALFPDRLAIVIGVSPSALVSFGPAILVFAFAVVVSSVCQLRVAELQGAGRPRQAMIAVGLSAALSLPLFFVASRDFGAPGLLTAWLLKQLAELTVLAWPGGRASGSPAGGSD